MEIRKIYDLKVGDYPSVRLRVPITIVDSADECRLLCRSVSGVIYWRKRRNYYTEEEWSDRCATLVNGIPCAYFAFGEEGDMNKLLGVESTVAERYSSRCSHERNREWHLQQMKVVNDRIRDTKVNAGIQM